MEVAIMAKLQIRWMVRVDLHRVLEIENASFEYPWSHDDLLAVLKDMKTIGLVAEINSRVAGFMVYKLEPKSLELLNFAVAPEFRREGIGSAMMRNLKAKIAHQRRERIEAIVSEGNTEAQLFFRSCGFIARGVLRDHYYTNDADGTRDGYEFVFHREWND